MTLPRRHFLAAAASTIGAAVTLDSQASDKVMQRIGLGFGTYGMKSLPVLEALDALHRIGYDGVDIALLSGWPSEPTNLSASDREEIRKRLVDLGLRLPMLLENLPCVKSEANHHGNLEKLKRATELAHQLSPSEPPIVQSIVGGKTSAWSRDKQRLRDELADWAKIGEDSQTVVCFKPHASHLVHDVERALWVHDQINSPQLKVVYDYSHFFLEKLSLRESLNRLLPITAMVQVKDSRGTPSKHEYLLPGEGSTDYPALLTVLKQGGYGAPGKRGFVNVEVSSMIHRKPGYQPVATAKLCFDRMVGYFEAAGVER